MSQAEVVAASRNFVCVRPATYMDAEESKFLTSIYGGRSGKLENTVFSILAPDGETTLVRSSRSPDMTFKTKEAFVEKLDELYGDYADDVKRKATRTKELPALPVSKSFPLALDIASCDSRPLVVALVEDEDDVDDVTDMLRTFAWSEEYIGRFHYQVVTQRTDLETVEDVPSGDKIMIVAPGEYGLTGEVLTSVSATGRKKLIERCLNEGLEKYEPIDKDHKEHVREGMRTGKVIETEVPVSDPHGERRRRDKEE